LLITRLSFVDHGCVLLEGTVTGAGARLTNSIGELEMGDEALHEVLLCIRRCYQLIHLGRFAELKISLCNAP
jgi:hypothetical protein